MKKATTISQKRQVALVGLLTCVMPLGIPSTRAQQQAHPSDQAPGAKPPEPAAQQQGETPETLHLMVGRSLVITSPSRVRRISIADPNIADTLIVSPTQIVVNGQAPG